jgi:hypothetical protein
VSLLGLCLILYAVFAFSNHTPTPSVYTLIPTVGAALIILSATPETHVGALLGSKAFVAIGLISYSAYLWHQPIFAFARHRSLADPSPPFMLALLLLSLGLAWLSWRFVEQPFRRRDWIKRKQMFAISGVLSVVFLTFGILGKMTDGYAFRVPVEKLARELAMVQEERQVLIKADICHFNNSTNIGVEKFLKQWNCKASSEGYVRIPLIVTGDSQSAGLVEALNLNGISPLQLGGAACSLVPRLMTHDCKLIFDKLFDEVKNDSFYQYIALVNNFWYDELTADAITEMLSYWQGFGKKLIFFSGMPHFPYFAERLTHGERPVFDHTLSDLSRQPHIVQFLRDHGVYVLDREKIFCAINKCGYLSEDGALLLADNTHLSKAGALLFGQKLLSADPLFRRLAGLPEIEGNVPIDVAATGISSQTTVMVGR